MTAGLGELTMTEACLIRDALRLKLRMGGRHHPDVQALEALIERVSLVSLSMCDVPLMEGGGMVSFDEDTPVIRIADEGEDISCFYGTLGMMK
jgi:hypothetical protein